MLHHLAWAKVHLVGPLGWSLCQMKRVWSSATLNHTTTACVDKISGINVLVCVPRPMQLSLQPFVHLMTGWKKEGERSCTLFLTVPTHYTRRIFICSFHHKNNFPNFRHLVHLKECNRKAQFQSKSQNQYIWPFFLLYNLAQKLGLLTLWWTRNAIAVVCNFDV